ncbi:hypothetical protein [Pseudomonas sp. LB3P38]|uniref:hypothetical protein n=1 Tax=Pseudomonas lyxosi TaxID=3398358 RepID=UPI0039F09AF7
MTNYNEDDLKTALTAIANGTLTQCKEKFSTSNGLYQDLYKERFITGANCSTMDSFVLDGVSLTRKGQLCLESFATA